jgi:DNA-binding transcriptional LysR family regulator
MQLESLKMFCDLASFRSFSKTAESNDISQPTVSRLIHQLEARLGGQLIDRSKRPLQLTAMGKTYYEGCKRLLEQYAELEASIRPNHTGMAITVRVAGIYSVGLWDMGRYVDRFEEANPHAKVRIDYLHPDQVYERVLDGTADLGLVSFPRRGKEFTVLPWREEEMVVACSPGHPLAGCETVSPQCLEGEKFVAFERSLGIRREVDRFLKEQGVTVDVVLEFDNIETIKKGIEVGGGLALLPEPMIRKEREAGTLLAARLEGCRMVRPLAIIHRRQHRLGAATQGFIDMLQSQDSTPTNGDGGR